MTQLMLSHVSAWITQDTECGVRVENHFTAGNKSKLKENEEQKQCYGENQSPSCRQIKNVPMFYV